MQRRLLIPMGAPRTSKLPHDTLLKHHVSSRRAKRRKSGVDAVAPGTDRAYDIEYKVMRNPI